MQKRRRLSVKKLVKFIVFVLLIIGVIVGISVIIYIKSDKYKLKQIGYNKEQITKILKFEKKYRNKILSVDYNEFLITLFDEKYFIFDNVDQYLDYHNNNSQMNSKDVVAVVNVGANNEHYTNTEATDTSKGTLMLVNKYHYLDENYKPDDIMDVKNWYAYENNQIRDEVYDKFIEMFNAAKKENLTIIMNSGYRDYSLQKDLYEDYVATMGEKEANKVAAKPGFSEHQTGLVIDVSSYTLPMEDFENTKEFKWMEKYAQDYGFILRYPKDKEHITGYDYESWHYRYVGEEVAKKIKELDITYDEYYEYFVK